MAGSSYLVVGAGAIGAIVGVHLARAGHDVAFVEVNAAHRDRMRSHGLRLTGACEAVIRAPVFAPEALEGRFGKVLLAVKASATVAALAPVAPLLADDGFVVSLQNGLEEYKIAGLVGGERTIGACLTFGGFYVEPGIVKFSGTGSFEIGELDGMVTPRLLGLERDLEALQPVTVTDNIFGYLWAKMALGAVYFGTAVVDADVLDIYARADCRAVLGRLCGEVVAVADALGVRIEGADGFMPVAFRGGGADEAAVAASWEAQRRYWNGHDNRRTGVWRDIAIHRRKTEVEWQIQPVITLADKHGVAVPYLRRLKAVVEAVESGARPQGFERLAEIGAGE